MGSFENVLEKFRIAKISATFQHVPGIFISLEKDNIFLLSNDTNKFQIAKSLWRESGNFFVVSKKNIIIILSYDTENFWIAHKFPYSNATLQPGFSSLWVSLLLTLY